MNVWSLGFGLSIFAVNLLLIKKKSHWDKTHTVLNLCAGVGLTVITSAILQAAIAAISWLMTQLLKTGVNSVPVLPTVLRAIPAALPWMIGAVLLIWLIIDMWPKKGNPDRPTAWVALFVPAGVALLPPLASAIGL